MTTKLGPHGQTALAVLIRERIAALEHRKSQREIAQAVGYTNQNMVTMIKQGRSKVALDRVAALADALEVDRVHLLNLALEQAGLQTVRDVIRTILGVLPTEHERQWLEAIREASDHTDPLLSKRARTTIFGLFGR